MRLSTLGSVVCVGRRLRPLRKRRHVEIRDCGLGFYVSDGARQCEHVPATTADGGIAFLFDCLLSVVVVVSPLASKARHDATINRTFHSIPCKLKSIQTDLFIACSQRDISRPPTINVIDPVTDISLLVSTQNPHTETDFRKRTHIGNAATDNPGAGVSCSNS